MAIQDYRGSNNQKYYTHDFNTRTNKKDMTPPKPSRLFNPIIRRNMSKKAIVTENLLEMRMHTDFNRVDANITELLTNHRRRNFNIDEEINDNESFKDYGARTKETSYSNLNT